MSGTARSMRAACAPVIAETVRRCPDLITLGADGQALFGTVIGESPERYVEVGIAESNLVGVAAGLARTGWRPVVGAMAPFLVRRAYEQLRLDVALPGLPVALLGVGGGLGYGALGPTHHAVDDIALMSALPHMGIYCPADAADAAHVLRHFLPPTRPAYVRLSARVDPPVFRPDGTAEPGDPHEVRVLRGGADALLLATGRCVAEASAAAERCAAHGLDVAVAAVTCLRPFPTDQVRALGENRPLVVTAAEELGHCGLGAAVAEALRGSGTPLLRLAVDDRHPPVGEHDELLAFHGVDRTAIESAVVRALIGKGDHEDSR
ncbi:MULTISPECIES: transketolase family protein [Streptomyces]|uniref:Transketolase n=1 Tax=Streptomyces cacaoi TaxID=1898 RepID=A0A4Y3QVA5_STRCI|nr:MULTISPECIES: transketolase C-terminal domain-containing protein [Streptomyces]NNG83389.1 transketolase family protein [Streptomyces cacaoi]QHF95396.1 transketolase [Streptomyces sp. NHF165]GEB49275.1 transketolase [Streptomyces cacaoi]